MSTTTLVDRTIKRIAEQAGAEPHEIADEHELVADLGFDSLDIVELTMALEEEFDCRIRDDDFAACATVQQVIDFVRGLHATETEGGAA